MEETNMNDIDTTQADTDPDKVLSTLREIFGDDLLASEARTDLVADLLSGGGPAPCPKELATDEQVTGLVRYMDDLRASFGPEMDYDEFPEPPLTEDGPPTRM
jgi:hypothetical protein